MTNKFHIYREVTDYGEHNYNHIYVFTEKPVGRSAGCVGYIPQGQNKVKKFSRPMVIDLKFRQFEKLT